MVCLQICLKSQINVNADSELTEDSDEDIWRVTHFPHYLFFSFSFKILIASNVPAHFLTAKSSGEGIYNLLEITLQKHVSELLVLLELLNLCKSSDQSLNLNQ